MSGNDTHEWVHDPVREIAESIDTNRRNVLKATGAATALGALGTSGVAAAQSSDAVNSKTRSTYYTTETVEAARDNVAQYDWAKQIEARSRETCDRYLDIYGLDGIWNMVTSQEIPRSSGVGGGGSPVTGEGISAYGWPAIPKDSVSDPREPGTIPALLDVITPNITFGEGLGYPFAWKPWKLVDPTSGYVFPTNDFAAYRRSGLDEEGKFDYDLADDSLLVNELYPDKPDDWGVDDGWGWEDEDGNVYTFVAYYNHFYVWYQARYMAWAFRDAYALTGDERYSRGGAVLLDRIADVYPELDLSAFKPDDPFSNSHGGVGQGKAIGGMAWGNSNAEKYLSTYDSVFRGMADDDALVDFLDSKTDEFPALERKDSVGHVRKNIEDGIVREMLPAVKNGVLRGSFGTHQLTLAWAAIVMDEPSGYTKDTLEFLFRAGEFVHEEDGTPWGNNYVTGGDVLPRIVDVVDRDGHYDKGSPTYNQAPLAIGEIADVLDGYGAYQGADLYANVKMERVYSGRPEMSALNRYMPHIGDTEGTGDPVFEVEQENMIRAFQQYGDPVYAQTLYLVNGNSTEGLEGDVFSADVDGVRDRMLDVIEAEGPLDLPSRNFAGYGYAALRDGEIDPESGVGGTKRLCWLYYGRNGLDSHNHADTLNLGLFAFDLDLLPELGYPESTGGWPKRHNWTSNTISHNTVVVDEEPQGSQWVGEPRHYDATDRVNLVDVEAPDVYPQTERYRRTVATVRVDDETSYVVDLFRVAGGDDHRYSFHAAEGSVATEGLDLVAQESGTYAGEDVPKPGHGEDTTYNEEVGNGFNYLHDVERDADPAEQFSVDWDVEDTWDVRDDDAEGVHLRLTMLGDVDELAIAKGNPPANPGNPDHLHYAIARRSGSDLESTFASVVEPYDGSRPIESISAVDATADGEVVDDVAALKIELSDGRTDYVVNDLDADRVLTVDGAFRFEGFFAVYSETDGVPEHAYVHDGELLQTTGDGGRPLVQQPQGRFEGTVEGFTRELTHDNEIVVKITRGNHRDPESLVGDWVYVETDGERNGAYEILDVESRRGNRVALDIGETTTVREFEDPQDPGQGYVYNIEEGAEAYIPRSASWDE